MATGGRDDERLDGFLLSQDIAQIALIGVILRRLRPRDRLDVRHVHLRAMPGGDLRERGGGTHLHAGDETRLGRVAVGHDHTLEPRAGGGEDGGKHARHGTQAPVEPELPQVHGLPDGAPSDHIARGQAGHRDREVEGGPVLGQTRR